MHAPEDRWQCIKNLFHTLLDASPGERRVRLAEIRSQDSELAIELAALLEHHDSTGTLLSRGVLADLAADVVDKAFADCADESDLTDIGLAPGDDIGPYRILQEIGRGGMGAVYLAARSSDFEQRVAIKRVQTGKWEATLEQRFLDERQILARLDHPNIARLLDGGRSTDGSPYLVMEYVEGLPIDEYCQQQRLSIRQRLELLRAVCAAVQYAHQNLIIHRDLKPSNILVTPEGVPKLLDFGIAKLLNGESTSSHEEPRGPVPMTPRYASPEQVCGESVSTASDVYALGLIAYQLLAGHLPETDPASGGKRRLEKPSVAVRQEQEQSTESTSTDRFRRRWLSWRRWFCRGYQVRPWRPLVGDLDEIVLKALESEPTRRYSSAEGFAEELRRHLVGLPVRARGGSLRYLAWKWLCRYRGAVVAAVLLVGSLLTGGIATHQQARLAEQEHARAELRFGEVRRLTHEFLFDFHDAIAELPGSTQARQLVVTTALEYLERLAEDAQDDSQLLGELASAYARIGDVQGHRRNASLGNTAAAIASYRRALDLLRLPALSKADRGTQRQLAAVHLRIGGLLIVQGDRTGARSHLTAALAISDRLVDRWPQDPEIRFELSQACDRMGEIQAVDGQLSLALASYQRALGLRRQLLVERPAEVRLQSELANSYAYVGDVLAWMEDPEAALASYRQALAIDQQLVTLYEGNAEYSHRLIAGHDRVGEMHSWLQDPSGALVEYRRAVTLAEELVQADPHDARAQRSLSLIYNRMGNALAAQGHSHQALESYLKALPFRERLAMNDFSNVRARRELAVSRFKLGESYWQLASTADSVQEKRSLLRQAREDYQRSFEILNRLAADDLLPPGDRDEPAELAARVARCETELASLTGLAADA